MADLEKLRLVADALRQQGFDALLQPKRGSVYVNPTKPNGRAFSFHQTAASGMWRGVVYDGSTWQEVPVHVPAASTDIARIAKAMVEAMKRSQDGA